MHKIREEAVASQKAKVKAMECDKPYCSPAEKADKLACGGTAKKED